MHAALQCKNFHLGAGLVVNGKHAHARTSPAVLNFSLGSDVFTNTLRQPINKDDGTPVICKARTEGWIQVYQGFDAHYSMQEHLQVPSGQLFQSFREP